MAIDIYTLNLSALLTLCGALFYSNQSKSKTTPPKPTTSQAKQNDSKPYNTLPFLAVYTLIMTSDWLQGPFLYPLYHDEHSLAPSLISTLFTTGFLSGAASGSVIGSLADKHGRKKACLTFCAVYALSCILTTIPSLPVLFVGRVLGGVGTSLLFSVFESWMVGDVKGKGHGEELGGLFGVMSTVNSVVAILSGVGSEWLVGVAGTRKAPFWAGVVCLVGAAGVIGMFWDENYGEAGGEEKGADEKKKAKKSVWAVLSDPKVLSLALSSTIFEGSMYLFVFFWAPALRSVQSTEKGLPYGIIFASFMAATLASSLVFAKITARQLVSYTNLLLGILGTSSLCFLLSARPRSEQSTFWVFCIFEAAVGMYFPCMGYLKGRLVDDGVRAQVYGMLRVPLNVFVVVSLLLTGDGNPFGSVFTICSTLLLAASGALWTATVNQAAP
ncbi:major facilitator superfamily transporter [Immersiella caudata]|uniref:Molybdate-anion transporter n=1 Tax=Immersiella caudata TaxID=314043 RepID=A0AA40BXJ6_9PEZI|nr:major facilitator superfamily transporter [Immersiella caudata]